LIIIVSEKLEVDCCIIFLPLARFAERAVMMMMMMKWWLVNTSNSMTFI
jgi:hypothetical protein